MKILFLHGWQSVPGSVKPTYLKDHGHEVLNPALPDDDFNAAVRIAQAEFDQHHPDVIVGSSRGGAVAMNISSGNTPLVLMCPAWKHWGTARAVKPGTAILHSKADETIPFAESQELLRNGGLPETDLIVIGYEHRLADPDSLAKMMEAVEKAVSQRQMTKTDTRRPWVTPKGLGGVLAFLLILPLIDLFGMLIALVMPILHGGGILVTVTNSGNQPLSSVRLHVTGAGYDIGDITAGNTTETIVRATGESGLEIEIMDTNGRSKRLNAGGYFESGYRGTIRVSIKDGVIDQNEQNIHIR